jgi:uncharacterized membrane protein YdjX (TVP38/TMEM64 family)
MAIALVGLRFLDAEALLARAVDGITRHGAWGFVLYALLYVLATVLFLPGWILTVGAGALFGVLEGLVVVSIGSTLGATAAFLVGRYVARGWIARRIQGNATFESLDDAIGREGGKIVGLARLSPVIFFNLLNYAFGLTAFPWAPSYSPRGSGCCPGRCCTCISGRWPATWPASRPARGLGPRRSGCSMASASWPPWP